MKKLLSVLLICSLLMGLLSGCGLVETLQDKILYEGREEREEKNDWEEIPAENVLRSAGLEEDAAGEVSLEYDFLGTDIHRSKILSVTFLDSTAAAPTDAVDVSEYENGKVLAWSEPNGDLHDVYIAADGGMYAPEDSKYLFGYLKNVQTIVFGDAFDTSKTMDIHGMFCDCLLLTELDVTGFDTSKVTNMSYMFYGCSKLSRLDVSGFDTSNVTDMRCMFPECSELTELDVTGFDTSNVTDMSWMFYGCSSLTELDVTGFDTSNVTDMSWMFEGCDSLPEEVKTAFD